MLLDTLAGRLVLFGLVLGLIIVAIIRAEARESRMVRTGAAILLVTAPLLALIPGLATGLLFWFSLPFAVVLILIGTIASFAKHRNAVQQDIAALIAAARHSRRAWPEYPPLPEIEAVARHGANAAPALLSWLRFETEDQLHDETWSPAVEQQVALALCRIYGETASGARTVYDPRATPAENARVKRFWQTRVGHDRA